MPRFQIPNTGYDVGYHHSSGWLIHPTITWERDGQDPIYLNENSVRKYFREQKDLDFAQVSLLGRVCPCFRMEESQAVLAAWVEEIASLSNVPSTPPPSLSSSDPEIPEIDGGTLIEEQNREFEEALRQDRAAAVEARRREELQEVAEESLAVWTSAFEALQPLLKELRAWLAGIDKSISRCHDLIPRAEKMGWKPLPPTHARALDLTEEFLDLSFENVQARCRPVIDARATYLETWKQLSEEAQLAQAKHHEACIQENAECERLYQSIHNKWQAKDRLLGEFQLREALAKSLRK